jgi:hypothetical protein
LSFGCGNACRFLCCLRSDPIEASPQIWKLNQGIQDISKKLDQLERRQTANENRRNSTHTEVDNDTWLQEDEQAELDDDMDIKRQSQAAMRNRKWKNMRSETWLNDRYLKRWNLLFKHQFCLERKKTIWKTTRSSFGWT